MTSPNPWQGSDADDFARSIAEQAKQQSEAAISKRAFRPSSSRPSADRDRSAPPITPETTLDALPQRRPPSDPDALARLIAQRAKRESEAYIGKDNGAGDRLLLYLILTPGIGMAMSPWMLVRSRSTLRQKQASRFALGAGAIWLVVTLLSTNVGDGAAPWLSLSSTTTWIYVFLMLSQMIRVWQRKSLPIKRPPH